MLHYHSSTRNLSHPAMALGCSVLSSQRTERRRSSNLPGPVKYDINEGTPRLVPDIHIRRQKKRRRFIFAKAMSQRWISTGGVLKSWEVGSEFADLVNDHDDDDKERLLRCDCNSQTSPRTLHLCYACCLPFLCSKMGISEDGTRTCTFCEEEKSKRADRQEAARVAHAAPGGSSRYGAWLRRFQRLR